MNNPQPSPHDEHGRAPAAMRILYLLGAGALMLVFLTPLIVAPKLFIFPFVTAKVWYMRTLIVFAAACLIPLAIGDKAFRYRPGAVHYAILLYAAALIANVLTSVDPHVSWYSGHERMTGVFTILHATLIAFIAPIAVRGWHRSRVRGMSVLGWRDVWSWIIIIAVYAGVVGVVQFFSTNLYFNTGGGRIDASLGNPLYLGHFSAVSAAAAAMMALREEQKRRKTVWCAIAVFLTGVLLMTGSRSAVLGIYVAAMVFVCLMWRASRLAKTKRSMRMAMLALIIIPVVVFATPAKTVFNISPATSRLVAISDDVSPRLHAWRIAWRAFRERPVIGWGQGNFYVPFNKYLEPKILGNSTYETWFDEAHNIVLNTMATTGALGTLAWLCLYASALMRAKATWTSRKDLPLVVGGSAMLVADFGSKLFAFDNAVSLILLFTLLAFASSWGHIDTATPNMPRHKSLAATGALAIIVASALIFETNVKPALANHQTIATFTGAKTQPERLKKTIETLMAYDTPHRMDITNDVAKLTLGASALLKQKLSPEEYRKLVSAVLVYHSAQTDEHQFELLRTITELRLAAELLPEADAAARMEKLFNRMTNLSPNRQQLYLEYADIKRAAGEYDAAHRLLDTARDIKPDVGVVFAARSRVYAAEEKWSEAYDTWEHAALDLGYVPESIQELHHAAEVIERAREPYEWYSGKLVREYERAVGAAPVDVLVKRARSLMHAGHLKRAHELGIELAKRHPETAAELREVLIESRREVDPEPLLRAVRERIREGKTVYTYELAATLWMLTLEHRDAEARDLLDAYMQGADAAQPRHAFECIIETTATKKPAEPPVEECF